MVVVTHEMAFAHEAASRIVFIDQGRVVETGAPETFFSRPQTDRARQFLVRYADADMIGPEALMDWTPSMLYRRRPARSGRRRDHTT